MDFKIAILEKYEQLCSFVDTQSARLFLKVDTNENSGVWVMDKHSLDVLPQA